MSSRNGHAQRNGTAARPRADHVAAGLTLRPAAASDAKPLNFFFDTALRNDYFLRRGQLDDMLRSRHHRVFVAEIDAVLVGVAIVTRGTRLVNVLIHPAYRGLGVGRALVGYTHATEVRVKRDMSAGDPRGFYRAAGFRSTGQCNGKGNIELMRKPSANGARRTARGAERTSCHGK